jgi:hypothetical protein
MLSSGGAGGRPVLLRHGYTTDDIHMLDGGLVPV